MVWMIQRQRRVNHPLADALNVFTIAESENPDRPGTCLLLGGLCYRIAVKSEAQSSHPNNRQQQTLLNGRNNGSELNYGLRHAPIRHELKDALLNGRHKPTSPVQASASLLVSQPQVESILSV